MDGMSENMPLPTPTDYCAIDGIQTGDLAEAGPLYSTEGHRNTLIQV